MSTQVRQTIRVCGCSTFVILAMGSLCNGDVVLTDETESRCWFAGGSVSNVFRVTELAADQALAQWRISAANHTVARGERALAVDNGAANVLIAFDLPALMPGVSADLLLELSVSAGHAGGEEVTTRKTLHSFSPDVFAHQRAWLTSLDIALLDPEKTTLKCFDDANIPYRFIRSTDALSDVHRGLIIVGEGVSLKENRALWKSLVGVVADGVPVLCLGLREGDLSLPGFGTTDSPGEPSALSLKRFEAITDSDKRLDKTSWCGERRVASHSLAFAAGRGGVNVRLQDGPEAWLWLEQSLEGSSANLVLCQFNLIEHWEKSPVPRAFLMSVLKHLDDKRDQTQQRRDP